MRITVELDDDLTAQIESLCNEHTMDREQVLNEALRLGLSKMEDEDRE